MRLAPLCLLTLAASACLPDAFSVEDGGMDSGSDVGPLDVGFDGGAQDVFDAGPPDMMDAGRDGAPDNRVNIRCPMRWADLGDDPPAGCEGRHLSTIGEGVGPHAVDIALLESGDIAVAWNDNEFIDRGSLELRVLEAESRIASRRATIDPVASIGEVHGISISLAGVGEDLHVAYWLRDDFGSTIQYRRWLEDGFLGLSETISSRVDRSGYVSIGIHDGVATFAYHDLISGRHAARTRNPSGELSMERPLGMDEHHPPVDSRSIALAVDETAAHVAYRRRLHDTRSEPFYRRRVDEGWAGTQAIDASGGDRLTGIAIDIAASGENIAVAYLDWSAGQTELRLASWDTRPEDAVVQILSSYASEEAPIFTALDVEFDSFGRLHLLWVEGGSTKTLEYWRQPSSGTGWIMDTIIGVTPTADLLASLVVGAGRQPHIAYATGSEVHYATIEP